MDNPLHDCHQICFNTDGGFNCSCQEGFVLLNDSKSCDSMLHSSLGSLEPHSGADPEKKEGGG